MPSAKAYALVLGVALAASVTSLRNGFVYDDVPVVVENRALRSLDSLPRLVSSSYWSQGMHDRLYRPATVASLAVDWALGDGRPLPFHAMNVLLHLAVVALVLGLGGAVLARGAVVAALWFAVHPVHVEVVANVVGRSELLGAAGYLAATLAFAADGRSARDAPRGARRAAWTVAVLLMSVLAFGAKEHTLTLPAALLLADAWTASRNGESFGTAFRRHALLWLGVVVLALGFLVLRTRVLGTTFGGGAVGAGLFDLTLPERAMVMLPVVLVWARLLAFPLHLSADYSPDVLLPSAAFSVAHALALLLLLAAVVVAWRRRRATAALGFGIVWFAITVSVAANVVFPTGVLVGERLLYLPSVGAALAVGALWELLPAGAAVWPLTAAALTLLAARTLERIPVWQTQEGFFATILRDAPASYRTHWQLGDRAFERGDAREGERELLHAARIWPYDAELLRQIGQRYLAAGHFDAAERFSSQAYALDSTQGTAAAQVILARLKAGRFDSADAFARLALRRAPEDAAVALAGIAVYDVLGQPQRVLALARRLTYADPRRAAYQVIAGEAARRLGLCAEAVGRLARALALAADEPARAAIRRRQAALGTCGARG